jgi:uncharacterized protein YukE
MFPKTDWEVNDRIVVNGKHGTIKEFSPDAKKVYVEHRDNENQPYVRWYDKGELPAFNPTPSAAQSDSTPPPLPASKGGETKEIQEVAIVQAPEGLRRGVVIHHKHLNYNRIIESVDGYTLTLAAGQGKVQWDVSVWEIVPPDTNVVAMLLGVMDAQRGRIDEIEGTLKEQSQRLGKQAATIAAIKSDEEFQDKYEQLHEDYEDLAKKLLKVETERDELKKVNDKQSELLKQAAAPTPFSTDVNPQKIIDSLRTENKLLERDNDKLKADLAKALQSPYEALEIRLAGIEEKLAEAADWIEGAVERSMDEAELAAERRVLELNQPVSDYAPLFLVMAKAFASAASVDLKAVG